MAVLGCAPGEPPSDDPRDWPVPAGRWVPRISEPRWTVPGPGLPADVVVQASNNNLDLELFDGRRFLAFRTAPQHFASPETRLYVISSADDGETWQKELEVALGADVREPRFLVMDGVLSLFYFEAGTEFFTFTPKRIWRTERRALGDWAAPEVWRERAGEVLWDLKVRGGRAYMGTYAGVRYTTGETAIEVGLGVSDDGRTFAPLDPAKPVLYTGGVSEIAIELSDAGDMWIVTRNEDGDASGFGSHVCSAPAAALASWSCPSRSDPERYDSPELFRHGDTFYVVARRDLGGPYDEGLDTLSLGDRRTRYQLAYWQRPKRTTLYRVDTEAKRLVPVLDLPSAGDTAYPAVRRTGRDTFLVANYTSPPDDPDRSWVDGQTAPDGTRIYVVELTFVPEAP